MYILISIFYISFIGLIVLLWSKRYAIKHGRPSFISQLGQRIDYVWHTIFDTIKRIISYVNKYTFIALAHWIAFYILLRIRKIYVEIKHRFISNHHGRKLIDAVRGRGEIRNQGVSFYLRRIGNEK